MLIRRAARSLRRTPAFTALAVLTLAVGIGAVTSVFSVVDAVLLRPLPYAQADRLVWIGTTVPGLTLPEVGVSDGLFTVYRDHQRALAELALYRSGPVNLVVAGSAGEAPRRVPAATATASLFPLLGVRPRLGRAFERTDELPGGPPIALLSDPLWRQLGADRGILGRLLKIDGVATQVVGVMPAGFAFPDLDTALWLPRRLEPLKTSLAALNDDAIGRLAPGATRRSVEADLRRLASGLASYLPGGTAALLVKGRIAPIVRSFRDQQVGDVGAVLWTLLGAVFCILAIACANVASLFLVRGEGRERERAIQAALGAPRRALLGGVLAESLLVAAAAGAGGVALAWGGLRLLAALRPPALVGLTPAALDGRTLAFAAALAAATSLLFGLVPAWRAGRHAELGSELKAGGRALTGTRGRQRLRRGLVALQMALAVVLLTGAGLMLESFRRLAGVDPGFDPRSALTVELALPAADYRDDLSAARFLDAALARIAALPGVVAAGSTSYLPLVIDGMAGHAIEDFPRPPGELPPLIGYEYVTAGFFRAMGIPLLAGRAIESDDAFRRTGAVVVSEALANHYWPHRSALGRRLRIERGKRGPDDPWYTIVGVAGNVRTRQLTETEAVETVYYPVLAMKPGAWVARQATLVVRTRVPPSSLAPAVRRAIAEVAPEIPLASVRTLEEIVHGKRSRVEFSALMVLLATAIALGLGGVGLYGFVSYLVGLRTAEIGIRMAMGADAAKIRWMILREALLTTAVGLTLGLAGAVAASRWLSTLLFQVSPHDPAAFATAPAVLVFAMLLAGYLPADRAAHLDPRVALERLE